MTLTPPKMPALPYAQASRAGDEVSESNANLDDRSSTIRVVRFLTKLALPPLVRGHPTGRGTGRCARPSPAGRRAGFLRDVEIEGIVEEKAVRVWIEHVGPTLQRKVQGLNREAARDSP